jgi:hypothetical protein
MQALPLLPHHVLGLGTFGVPRKVRPPPRRARLAAHAGAVAAVHAAGMVRHVHAHVHAIVFMFRFCSCSCLGFCL